MKAMFSAALEFNQDLSKWDVSKVKIMHDMFTNCPFNKKIDNWKINKDCSLYDMFYKCPLEKHPPKWYIDWDNKNNSNVVEL